MASAQARRRKVKTSPDSVIWDRVGQGIRWGGVGLLLLASFYLMLALVSFDPLDSAWTHTGVSRPVNNLGGVVGAWFGDVTLYFFGYMAYLLPLTVAIAGWWILRQRGPRELDVEIVLFRSLGVVVGLTAGCGLAALHLPADIVNLRLPVDMPMVGSGGGRLGVVVSGALLNAFGYSGGVVLLLVLCLAGITLATGLSWFALTDLLGKLAWSCGRGGARGASALAAWLRDTIKPATAESVPATAAVAGFDVPEFDELDEASPRYEDESVSDEQARSVAVLPPAAAAAPVVAAGTVPHAGGMADNADDLEIEPAPVAAEREPALAASAPVPACRPSSKPVPTYRPSSKPVPTCKPSSKPVPTNRPSSNRVKSTVHSALPPLSLLDRASADNVGYTAEMLEQMSRQVEVVLRHFGIEVRVTAVKAGPVITCFEMEPAPGIKVSQISSLSKDLARGLSVISVRIVEVIPGKSVVGLEIPNQYRQIVYLSEILQSSVYADSKTPLTLAMGKDIVGNPVIASLDKMPHLLVAGTTGSGKSVAVNAMLLSMLYKAGPEQVRLILIDPKMLELSIYEGIPHLLAPVVTDMKEAANALRWCVAEMERRYRLMAALKVRNIAGFNRLVAAAVEAGEPIADPLQQPGNDFDADDELPGLYPLPFIVVVIDELADMMMIVGKKVEELIARLAQKARASGIHLILATQRPSVDVITGLIKANIPTRVAFQVSSKTDSRTILDQMGAEQLLGHGDMLYLPPGTGLPQRVHGAFVDDHEVNDVVEYLKQTGEPQYIDEVLSEAAAEAVVLPGETGAGGDCGETDPLYDQAVRIVTETRKASISGVQRRLKIGYNRSARMIEEMEATGVVGPLQPNGSREVLAPPPPPAS